MDTLVSIYRLTIKEGIIERISHSYKYGSNHRGMSRPDLPKDSVFSVGQKIWVNLTDMKREGFSIFADSKEILNIQMCSIEIDARREETVVSLEILNSHHLKVLGSLITTSIEKVPCKDCARPDLCRCPGNI